MKRKHEGLDRGELRKRIEDEHSLVPDWCRCAILELLMELEYAEKTAHTLADEARENEIAARDEMREIEWRAKEEGYEAGMNGGWY